MITLAAYFHDIDPFVFRITDTFGPRWYGLSYVLGFIIAYFILVRLATRNLILIPPHRVFDAMVWLVAATVLGGRLGYALFYDPALLTTFTPSAPFWDFFALQKGGMASHGAMVGLTLACWRVSRGWRNDTGRIEGQCPMLHAMDAVVLVAPFGVFLGRIANFINGELLGKIHTPPGTPGPWWTVQFPQEIELALDRATRPQLQQTDDQLRAIADLAQRATPNARSIDAEFYALIAKAGTYKNELTPLLSCRHPSQIYQAIAEGVIVGIILWLLFRTPRKPGVIVASFLISYGVLRVATEFWRLPDAHLAVQRIAGLSRGQWLSVAMVVIGAWLLWYASSRATKPLGGWARKPA